MPVSILKLFVMLCLSALIASCSLSGVERIDAGCSIWRENTPRISSLDTDTTMRSVILLNEAMEKACEPN